ncbi:MAG TPA: FeoB small GTPase domain-containing protein, partial [Bryobacteraceae bacterium]|nr:FeoB small GTPase domain-containing protein [Bryobacteraceae bacterium]
MSDCDRCTIAGVLQNRATTNGSGTRSIAIVGPPNSGKSTLFNRITGLRQKVANYPGVTVERRDGRARLEDGREVTIIDLPGIYSLTPRSEDERVARDVLTGNMPGVPRPDGVLLILDSTNLSRHLVLAAPILALGLPTLVVLNMADDLRERGGEVDTEALSQQLGAPVILASAMRGEGLEPIWRFLAEHGTAPSPAWWSPRCRRPPPPRRRSPPPGSHSPPRTPPPGPDRDPRPRYRR